MTKSRYTLFGDPLNSIVYESRLYKSGFLANMKGKAFYNVQESTI